MQGFNPSLHGLRALAAIGVLLFHWAQLFPVQTHLQSHPPFSPVWHISFALSVGWLGVTLFFVLSGYLLTKILQDQPLSWQGTKRFWQRRFLRIYPAVWLQLFVLIIAGQLVGGLPSFSWDSQTLSNVLLFINLPPNFAPPINLVWWTLPIELSFYLILPTLVWLMTRSHWAVILTAGILITLAWRTTTIWMLPADNYVQHLYKLDLLPGVLTPFIAGMAISQIKPLPSAKWRYIYLFAACGALYWVLTYLAFNVTQYWNGGPMLVLWPSLYALCVATIVWCLLEPLPGLLFLRSKPLVWLGDLSFGLYLWHLPVFQALKHYWPPNPESLLNSVIILLAASALTTLLSALSFYAIEKPIMGWGKGPRSATK